jgi:predicted amino acid racemase
MARYLRGSTAANLKLGQFVSTTDGTTIQTGLTIAQADVRLSKNGAAFAQKNESTTATHDENGFYLVPVDTTDTNTVGRLRASVTKSGSFTVTDDFVVIAAAVYDVLFGSTALAVTGDAMTLTAAYDDAKTAAQAGDAMTLTAAYDAAKTASQAGDAMTLTAAYDDAKTAAQAGDQMDLVNAPNATAVTAIQNGLATPTNITAASGVALTAAYDAAKTAAQAGDAMTLTAAYDAAKTASQAGDAMTLTAAYDAAKTAAQAGDAMTLTAAYDDAKTAAQAGDQMDLVNAPNATAITAIQSGLATPTNITSASGVALTAAYDAAKTASQAGDAMTLTAAYDAAKTASQAGDAMTLTAAYDDAKTASQAGDQMDLVNAPNATAVTAIQSGLSTAAGVKGTDAIYDATQLLQTMPKGTAFSNFMVKMVLTDGTPAYGKTITVKLKKDAGALTTIAGAVTEILDGASQTGDFVFDLTGTEMNFDSGMLRCTGSGCKPQEIFLRTQS